MSRAFLTQGSAQPAQRKLSRDDVYSRVSAIADQLTELRAIRDQHHSTLWLVQMLDNKERDLLHQARILADSLRPLPPSPTNAKAHTHRR